MWEWNNIQYRPLPVLTSSVSPFTPAVAGSNPYIFFINRAYLDRNYNNELWYGISDIILIIDILKDV